jgi:hypothetical protein
MAVNVAFRGFAVLPRLRLGVYSSFGVQSVMSSRLCGLKLSEWVM